LDLAMKAVRLLLACLVMLLWAWPARAADKKRPPVLINAIVATIDNETITLEDVHLDYEVFVHTKVWFSVPEPPAAPTMKDAFDELVVRTLLYNQARKMGFAEVDADDVEKAVDQFRRTFPTSEAYLAWLHEHQITDDGVPFDAPERRRFPSIDRHFTRQLVIAQYLDKKISVQAKLGLNAYLDERRAELMQERPGATDDQMREYAQQKFFHAKVREHVSDLEKRAKIVVLRDKLE
jgi:hypothetical protein